MWVYLGAGGDLSAPRELAPRLKIAQLVPYYAPVIGGVEVVCQYISETLVARGHEVHVFTANRSHKGSPRLEMPAHETMNGVQVHRFRSYVNVGHYGVFPGFISPVRFGRFDIIHTHGYRQPQSEIGSRIGSRSGVPTILHAHGGFRARNRAKQLAYSVFDIAARRHKANVFDHFIALSERDKNELLELDVSPNQISIIQNAAESHAFEKYDSTRFREQHGLLGKRVILYLSILIRYKRPDILIRVLPRLVEEVGDVVVVFAGPDAGELEAIKKLADELGVREHYKWLGPLHGVEKHEALECAEFLALPSDEDPYPLALLEAMAHRRPVVTTSAVGQAPVIIEHEAGVVVSPGDVDGIAEGATRLLKDDGYRSALGNNARRLAENVFNVEVVVDNIERVYRDVAQSKRAGVASSRPR